MKKLLLMVLVILASSLPLIGQVVNEDQQEAIDMALLILAEGVKVCPEGGTFTVEENPTCRWEDLQYFPDNPKGQKWSMGGRSLQGPAGISAEKLERCITWRSTMHSSSGPIRRSTERCEYLVRCYFPSGEVVDVSVVLKETSVLD